ncbi:MAG: oxidoreductase, partial [Chloroflexota bacterium]
MRLAHKVALITGAGSGMGRVATRMFAEHGAKVIATDIHAGGLEQTVAELDPPLRD